MKASLLETFKFQIFKLFELNPTHSNEFWPHLQHWTKGWGGYYNVDGAKWREKALRQSNFRAAVSVALCSQKDRGRAGRESEEMRVTVELASLPLLFLSPISAAAAAAAGGRCGTAADGCGRREAELAAVAAQVVGGPATEEPRCSGRERERALRGLEGPPLPN